jgi:GLPGLI family protein
MKNILLVLFVGLVVHVNAQQRVVAECSVDYDVVTDTANQSNNFLASAHKTVYIKGNDSRTDLISSSFSQTIIYDKSSGNAVVLREIGNNKLITKLTRTQWLEKNKKFDSAVVTLFSDTKVILGYECKKATITLKNGSITQVFYTTAFVPSVREYEYNLKDVPGLVLEYETDEGKSKVKYVATKIDLSPVASSKFNVPTSGYRILN